MTKSPRGGFTLVELLVVIGIIAVLISILLPALSKARAAATAVACGSNLRQIGVAAERYLGEFGVYIPAGYELWDAPSGKWLTQTWDMLLQPYLGQKMPLGIYICPGDQVDRYLYVGANLVLQPENMKRSYSAVRTYGGSITYAPDGTTTFLNLGMCDFGDDSGPFDGNLTYGRQKIQYMRHIKPGGVPMPSQTLLLAECNQMYNVQRNSLSCWIKGASFQTSNSGSGGPPPTHASGTRFNYLFVDGHVELLRRDQTIIPGGGSTNGMWTRLGAKP